MIDPGALGTLVLGIEASRHDDERAALVKARTQRSRRPRAGKRLRLATALRRVAERLAPMAERPSATC